MGIKISEMPVRSILDGTEQLLVTVADVPNSLAVDVLADYCVNSVFTGDMDTSLESTDSVILASGKRASLPSVVNYAIATITGLDEAVSISGVDKMTLLQSGGAKNITISDVVEYIAVQGRSVTFDAGNISVITTIALTNKFYVNVDNVVKIASLSTLASGVLATLSDWLSDKTEISSLADDDVIMIIRDNLVCQMTAADMIMAAGSLTEDQKLNMQYGVF